METGLVASGSHTPDSYNQAVFKLQILSTFFLTFQIYKYIRIYVHFELFRDERRDTLHVGPQSKPFLSPILSSKIK